MEHQWNESIFVDRAAEVAQFAQIIQADTPAFALVIEADPLMGKTWLAHKMARHCEQERGHPCVFYINFRDRRAQHNVQDFLSLPLLIRAEFCAKLGQETLFTSLQQALDEFTGHNVQVPQNKLGPLIRKLRDHIRTEGPLQELVAFALPEPYEHIVNANATLREKILQVVLWARTHGHLPTLISEIPAVLGPLGHKVNWWEGFEALRNGDAPAQPPAQPATFTTDQGLLPRFSTVEEREYAERTINDAFFADLQTLSDHSGPILLLLDGYEKAPDEARRWVENELIERLDLGKLHKTVLIIAGRERMPAVAERDRAHFHKLKGLPLLSREDIEEYLARVRALLAIEEIHLDIDTLYRTGGRKPGKLADMVGEAIAAIQANDPFFEEGPP